MIGTEMACPNTVEIERGMLAALKGASRWRIAGDRLELLEARGTLLAAFEGRDLQASRLSSRASQASEAMSPSLEETSWQLVRFQGGDGTTITPDDKTKYTIEFGTAGRLTARIDCNRGRGTWKSSGPSLTLGPLVLTRAACPPGSLYDRIVKHWTYIRSYVVKDKHLFLSLMADGGIYEFEPYVSAKP
jgi:para-nitrobenzyl esterase